MSYRAQQPGWRIRPLHFSRIFVLYFHCSVRKIPGTGKVPYNAIFGVCNTSAFLLPAVALGHKSGLKPSSLPLFEFCVAPLGGTAQNLTQQVYFVLCPLPSVSAQLVQASSSLPASCVDWSALVFLLSCLLFIERFVFLTCLSNLQAVLQPWASPCAPPHPHPLIVLMIAVVGVGDY